MKRSRSDDTSARREFQSVAGSEFPQSRGRAQQPVSRCRIIETRAMRLPTTSKEDSNVKHEELDSIFNKIDDCDFAGARSELHSLAQDLALKGDFEYSDFLADYAYRSMRNLGNTQQTMPRSEIEKQFKILDDEFDILIARRTSILTHAYEHFKEIEKIAIITR